MISDAMYSPDADLVAFLYRDEYYNKKSMDRDIAKHRNGPVGGFKMRFTKKYGSFADLPSAEDVWADIVPLPKKKQPAEDLGDIPRLDSIARFANIKEEPWKKIMTLMSALTRMKSFVLSAVSRCICTPRTAALLLRPSARPAVRLRLCISRAAAAALAADIRGVAK